MLVQLHSNISITYVYNDPLAFVKLVSNPMPVVFPSLSTDSATVVQ